MRAGRGLPARLRGRVARFERYFRAVVACIPGVPPRLRAALRYSALSGGKRVRPLLAMAACEAVGGRWIRALPGAAAVECVHAFSLVHDDLPAMDDDDYRRGRPTTHKRFDDATAILAGDALLALAFQSLARSGTRRPGAAPRLRAVAELARAAGPAALVGGQMLDLLSEGRPPRAERVRRIHRLKTGALMRCALVLGGLAGNADDAQMRRLERLGEEAGLGFQIHDDLMNLSSSLQRTGKRPGTDRARGKATYPAAVGVERARREAAARLATARREAAALGPRARTLIAVLDFLAHREH